MRLKNIRQSKKLSTKAVAAALGLTSRTISHYECGSRKPTPVTLKKLAVLYGCTVDELIE